jgi:hypothetical protein
MMPIRHALLLAAALAGTIGYAAACGGSSPSKPSDTTGFRVLSAATSVDSATWQGGCPHRFTFTATITANAAGTATYQWERSDGSADPSKALMFTDAGSQTQTATWDVGSGVNGGWMRVRILGPNELLSNQSTFTLACKTVFAVTAVSVGDAGQTAITYAGTCPTTLSVPGHITANGAGTVTYHWEVYNGTAVTSTPPASLVFAVAGQQDVTYAWAVAASLPGTSWERLHVDTPNDLVTPNLPVSATCK